MELRELINKTHDLHTQLNELHARESTLKQQIETLESEIKVILDDSGEDYENLSEEEFQLLMSELGDPLKLSVEVVYATNNEQTICEVQLSQGANIEDAIIFSEILDKCNDIDLNVNKVGLHGSIKSLTETLRDGDRVEIYRAVTAKA